MSSSEQPKNENWCTYSDLKPIKVFEYPDQASKIIWRVNPNNILQISSQIIELITADKITIQMAFYLIDIISQIRVKDTLYFQLLENFHDPPTQGPKMGIFLTQTPWFFEPGNK